MLLARMPGVLPGVPTQFKQNSKIIELAKRSYFRSKGGGIEPIVLSGSETKRPRPSEGK
jgi:hypothetical protein